MEINQRIFDEYADEFGPEKVIHIYEPFSKLRAIVVIDNVAAGPAIGGVRMAPDLTTSEVCRLARAMTFKNAAAGLPQDLMSSMKGMSRHKTHPAGCEYPDNNKSRKNAS